MLRHTLGASGARRESISQQAFNFIHAAMEAFITLSTLRSRLYYVTLDWPAWYLDRLEMMLLGE